MRIQTDWLRHNLLRLRQHFTERSRDDIDLAHSVHFESRVLTARGHRHHESSKTSKASYFRKDRSTPADGDVSFHAGAIGDDPATRLIHGTFEPPLEIFKVTVFIDLLFNLLADQPTAVDDTGVIQFITQ